MADVTGITAVRPTANTQSQLVPYGATIAAGQSVYYSPADAQHLLADADNTSATAAIKGIAITPGIDDGFGYIATGGSIVLVGATLSIGQTYIVSDTPGGIKPISDAASGDFVTIIGNASAANVLDLIIRPTLNQVP